MYNITEAAQELIEFYPPLSGDVTVYRTDYAKCVVQAVKKYYVDINHPDQYDPNLFITDAEEIMYYDHDFDIISQEYIFILAKLRFKRMSMGDVTGDKAVSYTTNALSVTGAKEAYKSVQQEINDLEQERRIVFHKLMAYLES